MNKSDNWKKYEESAKGILFSGNDRLFDITPAPPQMMELRIVIWDVEDVPNGDIEGASDIYVQIRADIIGDAIVKRTETHYRALNGFVPFLII